LLLAAGLAVAAVLATARPAAADGPAAMGLDGGRVELGDFKTRGLADDQKTQWQLEGRHANVEGNQIRLKDATLTFRMEKGDTVVITSPGCIFDRLNRSGASDQPLRVVHARLIIDGVGYDILAAQQELHIRSRVKLLLKPDRDAMPDLFPGHREKDMGAVPAAPVPVP